MISMKTIRGALQSALEAEYGAAQLGAGLTVPQNAAKAIAVRVVDRLIHATRDGRRRKPLLYANRVPMGFPLEATVRDGAHESMLDVTVYEPGIGGSCILSLESEGSEKAETPGADADADDFYLWDLFKLLQVPSPVRIFMVRHAWNGRTREARARDYHAMFRDTVLSFAVQYARAARHESGDQLVFIAIPTATIHGADDLTLVGWQERIGRHRVRFRQLPE